MCHTSRQPRIKWRLAGTRLGNVQRAAQLFVVFLRALEFATIFVRNAVGAAYLSFLREIARTERGLCQRGECSQHQQQHGEQRKGLHRDYVCIIYCRVFQLKLLLFTHSLAN